MQGRISRESNSKNDSGIDFNMAPSGTSGMKKAPSECTDSDFGNCGSEILSSLLAMGFPKAVSIKAPALPIKF